MKEKQNEERLEPLNEPNIENQEKPDPLMMKDADDK